jgi:hypothetical protein
MVATMQVIGRQSVPSPNAAAMDVDRDLMLVDSLGIHPTASAG